MIEKTPTEIVHSGIWKISFPVIDSKTRLTPTDDVDKIESWYKDMDVIRSLIGKHSEHLSSGQMDTIWALSLRDAGELAGIDINISHHGRKSELTLGLYVDYLLDFTGETRQSLPSDRRLAAGTNVPIDQDLRDVIDIANLNLHVIKKDKYALPAPVLDFNDGKTFIFAVNTRGLITALPYLAFCANQSNELFSSRVSFLNLSGGGRTDRPRRLDMLPRIERLVNEVGDYAVPTVLTVDDRVGRGNTLKDILTLLVQSHPNVAENLTVTVSFNEVWSPQHDKKCYNWVSVKGSIISVERKQNNGNIT